MTFAPHSTPQAPAAAEAQAAALLAGAAAAKFDLRKAGLNWGPDLPLADFDGVALAANGTVEAFAVHDKNRKFDLGALVAPLLPMLTSLDASECNKATGAACARSMIWKPPLICPRLPGN